MDASTIKAVGDLAVDATGKNQFKEPRDIPSAAIISNKQVLLDMEHLQDQRRRYRGKLVTSSIPDYLDYAQRRESELATMRQSMRDAGFTRVDTRKALALFVDAEAMAAVTFFNLGDPTNPGHGDDKAVLTAKKTAPFAAALAVGQTRLGQADAAAWLEDWRDFLAPLDADRKPIALAAAIAAIRRVSIKERTESNHDIRPTGQTRTAFSDIEAAGAGGLPEYLSFKCVPYLGLPEVTFDMRVNIITSHDKPLFVFRVAALELLQERIAEDFKALLHAKLGAAADLTIGTFTP